MKIVEGLLDARGLKCAIVASRFNQALVDELIKGAQDALKRHGAQDDEQHLVWVPGAWEIPVVAKRLAQTGRFDALICVGCLIKGSTRHFEYIAGPTAGSLAHIGLETGVPITMGILTTESLQQAQERANGPTGNVGFSAAVAAIETAQVLRQIAQELK